MSNLFSKPPGNLPAGGGGAESEAERLVARARWMMVLSAVTTMIALGAVIAVISYRIFNGGSGPVANDGIITLPKGARVISTAASAGRVAVLFDVDGASELRTFDIKTLKQTGRIRFTAEP